MRTVFFFAILYLYNSNILLGLSLYATILAFKTSGRKGADYTNYPDCQHPF